MHIRTEFGRAAPRPTHAPARVLAFLAAVLTVVLGVFTTAPASAATGSAAEARVGAFTPAVGVVVGLSADITPRQRLGDRPVRPRIVVAPGVAAEDATVAERAAALCGGESFTPDTNVVMADGSTKPLDQVKIGDKVEATDPASGKTSAERVTQVWVNHDADLMDVIVKTSGKTSTIHATQKHLFWDTTRHAWTEADRLAVGDQLRTDSGTLATVASTVVVPGGVDMWDLTVDNDHDFYVVTTSANVLVHNCPVYRGPTDPEDPNYPDSSELMKPRSAGQPNYAENTQAHDAANQVGLNPEQERIFHDQITGRGITSYSELVQIAQDVADGNVH